MKINLSMERRNRSPGNAWREMRTARETGLRMDVSANGDCAFTAVRPHACITNGFPEQGGAVQVLTLTALALLTVQARTWPKMMTTTAMVTPTPTQTDPDHAPKPPPLNSPLRYSHSRTLRITWPLAAVAFTS